MCVKRIQETQQGEKIPWWWVTSYWAICYSSASEIWACIAAIWASPGFTHLPISCIKFPVQKDTGWWDFVRSTLPRQACLWYCLLKLKKSVEIATWGSWMRCIMMTLIKQPPVICSDISLFSFWDSNMDLCLQEKKALLLSQLQEGTLAKAEAQKAAQEIRSLQKQADTEEKENFAIQEEIEALKVNVLHFLYCLQKSRLDLPSTLHYRNCGTDVLCIWQSRDQ